jgi:hypothetical protein
MEALFRKKKRWEFQNQQVLKRLTEVASDLVTESVKAAVRSTSFLLYLIYAVGSVSTNTLTVLIRGMLATRLVRRISRHHRPEEIHEIHQRNLELQYRSRVMNNIIK